MEPINLFKNPGRLAEVPKSVKLALGFLIAAWIVHFIFYYNFTIEFQTLAKEEVPEKILYMQLTVAILTCYFLIRFKNWARSLCIIGNLVVITPYLLYIYVSTTQPALKQVHLVVAALILFGLGTTYLFLPVSGAFFKSQFPPKPVEPAEENQ